MNDAPQTLRTFIHKVKHGKGLSLRELQRKFPTEEAAHDWFVEMRWPDGVRCPRCKSDNVQTKTAHRTMPFRCRPCHRYFSVRVATVMQDSKLDYRMWIYAIFMVASAKKGVSSTKLAHDLGISQGHAWHLAHRIREGWVTRPRKLAGPLEFDETYVGGINKNRSYSQRKPKHAGTMGKFIVIGLRDRSTGLFHAEHIADHRRQTFHRFVRKWAHPTATIYTDEHFSYRFIPFRHEVVNHNAGDYVDGDASTNSLESVWALLKRAYKGVFHWMSARHLQRYVNEICGRFNNRHLDTIDQMAALVRGFDGRVLTFQTLVTAPEVPASSEDRPRELLL